MRINILEIYYICSYIRFLGMGADEDDQLQVPPLQGANKQTKTSARCIIWTSFGRLWQIWDEQACLIIWVKNILFFISFSENNFEMVLCISYSYCLDFLKFCRFFRSFKLFWHFAGFSYWLYYFVILQAFHIV